MKVLTQVRTDISKAAKEGDKKTLGAARLLLSALEYRRMQKANAGELEGIEDEEELQVVRSEVKKRQEAMEIYKTAGEKEREEQEGFEAEYMSKFLPSLASEEEVKKVVSEVMASLEPGVNRGQVIGMVIGKMGKDKVDGTTVARVVNQLA